MGKDQNMSVLGSNIDKLDTETAVTEYDTSAWSRAVMHIIALANQQNVRTLGITATQTGAGVSTLSNAVCDAYISFGRRTLLAQSSGTAQQKTKLKQGDSGEIILTDPLTTAAKQPTLLSLTDVLNANIPQQKVRNQFNTLTDQFEIVVIDLPPVSSSIGHPTPEFLRYAPLCDLIYLTCLTGVTTRREVTDCIEQCSINDVKLGGIIMNDIDLIGSQFISS